MEEGEKSVGKLLPLASLLNAAEELPGETLPTSHAPQPSQFRRGLEAGSRVRARAWMDCMQTQSLLPKVSAFWIAKSEPIYEASARSSPKSEEEDGVSYLYGIAAAGGDGGGGGGDGGGGCSSSKFARACLQSESLSWSLKYRNRK